VEPLGIGIHDVSYKVNCDDKLQGTENTRTLSSMLYHPC